MGEQLNKTDKKIHFVKGDGFEHYHFTDLATVLDENHILTAKNVDLDIGDSIYIENKKYIVTRIDNRYEFIIYTIDVQNR